MRGAIGRLVDWSGRRPWTVLAAALVFLVASGFPAARVLANPHTDLRELLPTDSPGLQAFDRQLRRIGGGATLIVVAESPSARDSERFIDALALRLEAMRAREGAGGLVAYVETGAADVRAFFDANRWLYADLADLRRADAALDREIAIRSGAVEDLESGPLVGPAGDAVGETEAVGETDAFVARLSANALREGAFPGAHFESEDGRMVGLRVVSRTTGLGDRGGDALLSRVAAVVSELRPDSFHPGLRVGYAGDIANAAAEKDSLVGEAAWASGIALALIVGGIVCFFGSPWCLPVIAMPAILGVAAAYAFAWLRFGYVNTTGLFLGAIILGNGINYPIVLLARYREFRLRGQPAAEARREAVESALRAELVGASVAAIAYGSLTFTRFRGFSQFGWIGFVGMLLVWTSMIPCVPALLVVLERVQARLPRWARDPIVGGAGPAARRASVAARLTRILARRPGVVVAAAVLAAGAALWRVPAFLRDPWEYNFDRLGSRGSKRGGAGEWSNKADLVFGGRANVAGAKMVADAPEQVPLLKARILANDAADPEGRLLDGVITIADVLPGSPDEQRAKLAVLDRIRRRLSSPVLADLPAGDRARLHALRPPDGLHVLGAADLPEFLRRRFEDAEGRAGAAFYVQYRNDTSLSDGHNLLRLARTTDDVRLPDGTVVETASRPTVFAEMIRSMRRDGPRATLASLLAVAAVVIVATRNARGAAAVLFSLGLGVAWLVGGAAWLGEKLNYVNFIVLPITFGIGCEYPFNVFDRARLLGGDVIGAMDRVGGVVALCSFTTVVGYGSLLVADFQALQSFGRLAVAGELACATAALVVLPALLRLFAGAREGAEARGSPGRGGPRSSAR